MCSVWVSQIISCVSISSINRNDLCSREVVFPVRYVLNLYILFIINSILKGYSVQYRIQRSGSRLDDWDFPSNSCLNRSKYFLNRPRLSTAYRAVGYEIVVVSPAVPWLIWDSTSECASIFIWFIRLWFSSIPLLQFSVLNVTKYLCLKFLRFRIHYYYIINVTISTSLG